MKNKPLILYPEILAKVIKNGEEDLFTLWLFAKTYNKSNNGLIDQKDLIEFSKNILGLQSNYIYNKIKKGINLYWRNPTGTKGNKKIGLLSLEKITERLKPELTRCKPVLINYDVFEAYGLNSKNIKNLYISIVAGRYDDKRPISFYSLIHNMGISESSIRHAIKDCVHILTKENYSIINENTSLDELIKIKYSKDNDSRYKILENDNIYQLLKQEANSYILTDFDRLPLKYRPKFLRKYDKLLLDCLEDKRYNVVGTDKFADKSKLISFNS